MSNIPRAREILAIVLAHGEIDAASRRQITRALRFMTRESPVRRSKPRHMPITADMRRQIRRLADSDMSQYDIAERVGLRNAGRVSEVLSGKR